MWNENIINQEVDFFEKFGSCFREYLLLVKEEEREDSLVTAQMAPDVLTLFDKQSANEFETYRNENAIDSDENLEDPYFYDDENYDELYSKTVYKILYTVGCDADTEDKRSELLSYIRSVFKVNDHKHNQFLSTIKQKKRPDFLLNVKIIKAKDLATKDSNGLSDSFVTLYLASNPSKILNTFVKNETLNPTWKESFSLPLTNYYNGDTLCLEVWDYAPIEDVTKKLKKIFKVKGVREAKMLCKEIASSARTPIKRYEKELIGSVKIPLNCVPSSGITSWYNLAKKNKAGEKGTINVQLMFSTVKNHHVALQEYQNVIRALLLHELKTSQVGHYKWNGRLCDQAESILIQQKIQSGLSYADVLLQRWIALVAIQKEYAICFSIYVTILDQVEEFIHLFKKDDIQIFCYYTKILLAVCFKKIRITIIETSRERIIDQQITHVLRIISKLININYCCEEINLTASEICRDLKSNGKVRATLLDNIVRGAQTRFTSIANANERQSNDEEERLIYLIHVVQSVRTNLQMAVNNYDKTFREILNIEYAEILYDVYQKELSTLIEPKVYKICDSLMQISHQWNSFSKFNNNQQPVVDTKLFELYLFLQRFILLGNSLNSSEYKKYHINDYYKWFRKGVVHWLDIAAFIALQRIEKAVQLDDLVPADKFVKNSSSALDTLVIFHEIKIFWNQLDWPDIKDSFSLISMLINNICHSCVFYTEQMDIRIQKIEKTPNCTKEDFKVTKEWCLAINNINHVSRTLKPFTEDLQLEHKLQQLALTYQREAEIYRENLHINLENSLNIVTAKIAEILEAMVMKMILYLKKLLIEKIEVSQQNIDNTEKIMKYLDRNLEVLHEELDKDNFNNVLVLVWDHISKAFNELIELNIKRRPAFFQSLRQTFQLLVRTFKQSEDILSCNNLCKVDYLLNISAMETRELIHQVCLEQYIQQNNVTRSLYGEICVRLQFLDNALKIEVINGRNVCSKNSNGLSNSFVTLNLVPVEKFKRIGSLKTRTHSKNMFPLYDEIFIIDLTEEQKSIKNALVQFTVKNKSYFGFYNTHVGKAFIKFSDIPDANNDFNYLPQIRLQLYRPSNLRTDAVRALEQRRNDREAKSFIKLLKKKEA